MDPTTGPTLIGWKEYLDFPDWDVHHVKVKIDTGARTSVLDAASCELRETEGGLIARLHLALHHKDPGRLTVVEAPIQGMVIVRNSTGLSEQRPLIETTIRLGPVTKRVCLTVTNRAGMRFRMLLGRKALEGDFVVDVSKKYVLRGKPKGGTPWA